MRLLAKIGLSLAALAVVPVVSPSPTASAQSVPNLSKPWNQVFHKKHAKTSASKEKAAAASKTSHLCNECRRELIKLRTGVEVPPTPPMPAGTMVNTGPCSNCKAPVMVVREEVAPQPLALIPRGNRSPQAPAGMAVASDQPMPGEPMLVSAEPLPIGIYSPNLGSGASAGPRPGPMDPSVMTASGTMGAPVPAASNPIIPPRHNRPHIISHLFGLSSIGRDRADERERKAEESHAMIQYGTPASIVTELPSKMVYGK